MILLDPGHGPGDGVVAGRTVEHSYCHAISRGVLRLVGSSRCVISREQDVDPSNKVRAEKARRLGCGMVISTHVNSGPPEYSGAHAFHRPNSRLGKAVAESIMTGWPKELSRKSLYGKWKGSVWIEGAVARPDRKYWPRVAQVFEDFGDVDLVLVEMFYATNPVEDELAYDGSYIKEMGLALARGILVAERGLGQV